MFAKVYPLSATSKDATVRQPKELICFSRDIDNNIHLDDSELSYYYLPDSELNTPGGLDLQSGFSHFNKNPKEDVGELTGLLKAVESYERAVGKKIPVDVITWRGLMRQLMMLPYENRDKLVLNIVVFDGQLFIQTDVPSLRAIRTVEEARQTELNKRQVFSGYKFENVSTLKKPWAQCSRKHVEKRFRRKVNNIEQYSTVVRTTIGKTRLLLGAEVDCAWDFKPDHYDAEDGENIDPLRHYVELKTTGVIDSPKACATFERKLLRTWSQCFLAGIPKVIYGFRDNNLILRSVEEFKTEEIPILLRDAPFQKPVEAGQRPENKCMRCLKFFSGLINWLNENIPKNDESKTYRLEYDPVSNKNYINVRENDAEVTEKLLGEFNGPDGGMLTTEFREWRKSN
ncbi:DEKNAAC102172 [Brettanomyces naardenensis]|uniref:Decapping nuclease n=1 Tax=Brettanomyces naardenensis TaxID=13370 RepID=A0A448YK49_BRENA|nr:DEKNAAC102172 [Brettanomyces naardenensis]